jgi:hypothetical protein
MGMELSYRRPGVIIMTIIGAFGPARAGMQLETTPAAAIPVPAAPPASKPSQTPGQATPRPRATAVPATARQEEKAAWPACIRLLNAASLVGELDADRRQALLEQCAS